jgi:peptidoglycan biosynthesis protein MviN/MurJ (putative lipid II flippase)
MRPLALVNVVTKSDVIVDRAVASFAPVGALSIFAIVFRLYAAVTQIASQSLGGPALRESSLASAEGSSSQLDVLRGPTRRAAILGVGGWVGLIVLLVAASVAGPVGLRERLPDYDLAVGVAVLLGGVAVFGAVGQIVASGFYGRGDTKTPAALGLISFLLSIPMKLLGVAFLGVIGLSAATSMYFALSAAFLVHRLRKTDRRLTVIGRGCE